MLQKWSTWIVLALLSAGAVAYSVAYFGEAFPIVNVDLQMDRPAALDSARARAERFGYGPEGFSQAGSFETDREVQTFVELEAGGRDAYRRMIETGLIDSSSAGVWALNGVVLGVLFGLGYAMVARYDRAVIPIVGATIVGLEAVHAMVTAAHSYAFAGEGLALGLVLGGGIVWTRRLRRRQLKAADEGPVGQ